MTVASPREPASAISWHERGGANRPPLEQFAAYLAATKLVVDRELEARLRVAAASADHVGMPAGSVVEAIRALTLRGGKRFRPALLALAYEACGGEGGVDAVAHAGASLELLQSYLLIHDDWIDGDDFRRGGPSVHAQLRREFASERLAASGAILAGDLASALAQQALFDSPLGADVVLRAAREFAAMQYQVGIGQVIDVHGAAERSADIERMYSLKTGSYTVRGPLLMGAALAAASPSQIAAIKRFARPLGIAFQLRDDVLGVFGDPARTGKPRDSDLRHGKRTMLVAELERSGVALEVLARVLGRLDASDEDVERVIDLMTTTGSRARVEVRILVLLDETAQRLAGAPLLDRGRTLLLGAIAALGVRDR